MKRYPTRNGIAVTPNELWLPRPRTRETNTHHNEWTAKSLGRSAVTLALRNLERHQYVLPVNVHNYIHDHYDPPQLPTEGQAAKEVIEAYEMGERFRVYNKHFHRYDLKEIPPELVDEFVAAYSLRKIFCPA